ncbi:MAG: hypothetical protein IK126_06415 [Bacteroidales bacterium]|nr:hypothetical protein [Bacteroidales bacterium]
MKRFILLAFLMLPVLPAAAQFFVSGNLDFDLARYSRSEGFDPTKPKGMALRFEPRVGYAFSPSLQAGVTLLLSNQKYTYTDGYYNADAGEWKKTEITDRTLATFGGGLFVRQRCLEFGSLALAVELTATYHIGLGNTAQTQYDSRNNSPLHFKTPYTLGELAVKLVPVVTYRLSQRLSVDGYIDLLSILYTGTTIRHNRTYRVDPYTSNKTVTPEYSETLSSLHFGLDAHNATLLTLGVSYNF